MVSPVGSNHEETRSYSRKYMNAYGLTNIGREVDDGLSAGHIFGVKHNITSHLTQDRYPGPPFRLSSRCSPRDWNPSKYVTIIPVTDADESGKFVFRL